jgi:hypothetical protein
MAQPKIRADTSHDLFLGETHHDQNDQRNRYCQGGRGRKHERLEPKALSLRVPFQQGLLFHSAPMRV